jgi:hypothetical protein
MSGLFTSLPQEILLQVQSDSDHCLLLHLDTLTNSCQRHLFIDETQQGHVSFSNEWYHYISFFKLKSPDDTLWVKFWDSFFGKEDTSTVTISNRMQPDSTTPQHKCLRTKFLNEYNRFWKLSVMHAITS